MLARRFTIVCLLTAMFGILFAVLVAEASRTKRMRAIGAADPCPIEQSLSCQPRSRN